jgi:hypothetical protein
VRLRRSRESASQVNYPSLSGEVEDAERADDLETLAQRDSGSFAINENKIGLQRKAEFYSRPFTLSNAASASFLGRQFNSSTS